MKDYSVGLVIAVCCFINISSRNKSRNIIGNRYSMRCEIVDVNTSFDYICNSKTFLRSK